MKGSTVAGDVERWYLGVCGHIHLSHGTPHLIMPYERIPRFCGSSDNH